MDTKRGGLQPQHSCELDHPRQTVEYFTERDGCK